MEHVRLSTGNILDENVEKLAELFPEVVTEVREPDGSLRHTIDVEALKARVGDVAEGQRERYQFTWPGKRDAKQEAYRPIDKCLRPCPEESVNWDMTENLYIEGDNLDALKLLRNTYAGKIKMIYIDPPYNTGHDFIYDDDFARTKADYDAESGDYDEDGGRLVANPESNGRFHSDWCSMMYPRLLLARDLLSEDGVIFVSIDDNEVENAKRLLSEVFGVNELIAQVALLCNPKGRSQDKYVATCHEYLLIFSKRILHAGAVSIPKSDSEIADDYPLFDKGLGRYRELELRNTHREFGRFNRPNLYYPIYVCPDTGRVSLNCSAEYNIEVLPIWNDGFEGCWTWGKAKAGGHIRSLIGRATSGQWKIYRKAYAYEGEAIPNKQVKSIWNDKRFFTEKGQVEVNCLFGTKSKLFPSPKSVDTICQILLMGSVKESIILDFFSGSATTAHAVMKLNAEDGGNRKFIMVQLPEVCDEKSEAAKAGYKNICEIGKERIRRAGKKIAAEVEEQNRQPKLGEEPKKVPDIGFRVLKIDSSNFEDVSAEPAEYTQQTLAGLADNLKPGRTAGDLLFQVLPQFQIPLSAKIETREINGSMVFSADDGRLVACFDRNVSTETIVVMAKMEPNYAVMRDASFTGDDAVSNFGELFKTYSPATITRVV